MAKGTGGLMSGHHANIEKWRREQSIYRTAKRRPDLLKKADLTNKEWSQVRQWKKEWRPQKLRPLINKGAVYETSDFYYDLPKN